MDIATFLVDVWIALIIIAVIAALVRAWRARPPRLGPLPADARNRYVQAWEQVTTRFVHAPQQAVREADALVMSLLRERGHPLDHERLPSPMVAARRTRISGEERGETETLRRALIRYRAVFEKMIGDVPGEEAPQRREMA